MLKFEATFRGSAGRAPSLPCCGEFVMAGNLTECLLAFPVLLLGGSCQLPVVSCQLPVVRWQTLTLALSRRIGRGKRMHATWCRPIVSCSFADHRQLHVSHCLMAHGNGTWGRRGERPWRRGVMTELSNKLTIMRKVQKRDILGLSGTWVKVKVAPQDLFRHANAYNGMAGLW